MNDAQKRDKRTIETKERIIQISVEYSAPGPHPSIETLLTHVPRLRKDADNEAQLRAGPLSMMSE